MKETKLTTYTSKKQVLAFEIGEVKKTKTKGKGRSKVEVPLQGSGALIVPENKNIEPVMVNNMFLERLKPKKGDFYIYERGAFPTVEDKKTFSENYEEVKVEVTS